MNESEVAKTLHSVKNLKDEWPGATCAQWNFYRELCDAKNDETKELAVLHSYYLKHQDWFNYEITELENALKSYRKHWSRDCYLKLLVKYLLNLKDFNPIQCRKRYGILDTDIRRSYES
jgi:hypothetical protein